VDVDKLSPRLGRLIDEAKAAALRAGPGVAWAEGVALLTAADSVYVGYPDEAGSRLVAAAEMALAVPSDPSGTVLPSKESRCMLAGVDPDLQIVFKQRGRWVMLPLSEIAPAE
jgi:hypothetical protein